MSNNEKNNNNIEFKSKNINVNNLSNGNKRSVQLSLDDLLKFDETPSDTKVEEKNVVRAQTDEETKQSEENSEANRYNRNIYPRYKPSKPDHKRPDYGGKQK